MSDTERWVPVIIKHHGEAFEKGVFGKYEVSDRCIIRNTKTKRILSNKTDFVGLSGGGMRKTLARYRVCIASFYPDKIPENIDNYDVDHIDGNHDNNELSNLQWLSRSEHCKKTRMQTKGRRKSQIKKQGKKVKVVAVKRDGKKYMCGRVFDSCHCAARELDLKHQNVSSSARKGHWVNGKYMFEFEEELILQNEVWKPIGNDGCQISNKGRFKTKRGNIINGANIPGRKYRRVNVKLNGDKKVKQYLVHVIVWIAFNGPIPDGLIVMHNDTYNTLDEDGYERNWLEDLSLGTFKQNSQSYHNNRTGLKRVRDIETGIEYRNAGEAARVLGLDCGSIHSVCKKRTKTAGRKRFQYVN